MHRAAARDELAAFDRAVATAEIADEAASLAHQQHAGGDVPDVELAFPETVETARRDPCEVEAGSDGRWKSVGKGAVGAPAAIYR